MNKTVALLILANVLLTSFAQVCLKGGMTAAPVTRALESGLSFSTITTIGFHPLVASGLSMYVLSAVVWLLVLARVELSLAYPFIGAGFVITMVLAAVFYGDSLSFARVGGTLLIAAGIAVLAQS